MIEETFKHYQIIRRLGAGGMGEVYLARDTSLERNVALKFLPPAFASDAEALARFQREARAAAALNHPNIITIHEVSEHEGRPYIAMAYIDGRSLADVVASEVPADRAIGIAVQMCEGLHKAHQAHIVHRDIKPANVIVDADGRAKILDFGLAMRGGASKLTKEDSTVGTVGYMSPEQARGDDVDHRTDIFSLGAVLYEMIAGRPAFAGDHPAAILYAIANEDPQPVSRYNAKATPELDRILAKALAKDPEARYQSAADLAADLKQLRAAPSPGRPAATRRRKRWLVPGIALAVAVALFLVFKPFRVDLGSDQVAEAAENTLAIMYFENLAQPGDPERLGEIMSDLLITNLSQTGHAKVVSSQRLYDILKLLGKEGAKVVDRTTATAVAQRAGARWMMLGRILQVEPRLVVTSQLVEVATGNVEAAQRAEAAPGETVFSLVDRMTAATQSDLPAPAGTIDTEASVSIADVTTHSVEAYRHYLTGVESNRRFYYKEAEESYRKAIASDSTFAMAYFRLSEVSAPHERAALMRKAVKYSDRATKKEQLYIHGMMDFYNMDFEAGLQKFTTIIDTYPDEKDVHMLLGIYYHRVRADYAKAAEHYEAVVQIDPTDKTAYNQLSYAYNDLGDLEKSLWAINRYIELAPGEANPYDSRADLYAYTGQIDEAIDSYKTAIAIKPDFYDSVEKLGNMYVFKGEYERAEALYRKLAASGDAADRARGRLAMAFGPLRRGDLAEAMARLEAGLSADELEGYTAEEYVLKLWKLSWVCTVMGEHERAIAVSERAADRWIANNPSFRQPVEVGRTYAWIINGQIPRAAARLDSIGAMLDQLDEFSRRMHHWASGILALQQGEPAKAVELIEASGFDEFEYRYDLGRAYLALERFDKAAEIFERTLNRYDQNRAERMLRSVRAHYLLGLAYEGAGHGQDAIEQYRTFLTIWKDADPRLEETADARARLRALEGSG